MGLKFVLINHVNSSLCHLTIGFTQHFWLHKRGLSLSPENSSRITSLLPQVHQGLVEKFRVTGSSPMDVEVIIEKSHLLIIQQFLDLDW